MNNRASMRHRQSGVVLFIALMVLVAMTMAGLALIRSADSGLLVAGNLTFKRNSVSSGDAGIEAGYAWSNGGAPEADVPANGYYATALNSDPQTWDLWNDDSSMELAEDEAGNSIRVVTHRMCDGPGPIATHACSTVTQINECDSKGPFNSLDPTALGCPSRPYLRVTAQVTGPKGTLSYVQAMIY